MKGSNLVYTYYGTLFDFKKEENPLMCDMINESERH